MMTMPEGPHLVRHHIVHHMQRAIHRGNQALYMARVPVDVSAEPASLHRFNHFGEMMHALVHGRDIPLHMKQRLPVQVVRELVDVLDVFLDRFNVLHQVLVTPAVLKMPLEFIPQVFRVIFSLVRQPNQVTLSVTRLTCGCPC